MTKTSWNLYTSNEEGWDAMLEACNSAKKTIDIEQFIFITNEIGQKFLDVCKKKAKEGVKVRLLWDAAGSFSFFGSNIAEELKEYGIELVFFKTLLPSFFTVHNYKSWYFRNHKRTLVVDSKVGFTGSICVSDEMKNWRDTVVRIEGSVVGDMEKEFETMWRRALKKGKDQDTPLAQRDHSEEEFEYVANYPFPKKHEINKRLFRAIREAKKHIYITTPYFVPTRQLSKVLRAAARRGVEIKLIIPEWSDHPVVDLCSRSFFTKMLKVGMRIYLYKGKMIHSKTIIIDGNWASVGTLNLDTVSLLYNFEANLITTNSPFNKELSAHFENDLLETEEITYEKWKSRYWVEKFFGFFMRLFRDFL